MQFNKHERDIHFHITVRYFTCKKKHMFERVAAMKILLKETADSL